MQRERDIPESKNEEERFNLSQAKKKSEIRIQEGRPKLIDILFKNLTLDQVKEKKEKEE